MALQKDPRQSSPQHTDLPPPKWAVMVSTSGQWLLPFLLLYWIYATFWPSAGEEAEISYRSDVLDPALLRPGRFDRQIVVALPDHQGREGILRIHTRMLQLADDVNLNTLARSTVGMSGADLANLCNEAALVAARHGHDQVYTADFETAADKILLGRERPLLLNESQRRIIAYHEAGHAMIAWLLPHADPVHKATIIPHGRALGVAEQPPQDDQYNYSRAYLMDRLAVMLGGGTKETIDRTRLEALLGPRPTHGNETGVVIEEQQNLPPSIPPLLKEKP